jgi:glycosyltransferase involved in cell wall biosynthesis
MAPQLCVLVTRRALAHAGGHERALLGWLQDAHQFEGLHYQLVGVDRYNAAQALARWPRGQPLLLAPGVVYSAAWLLALAVAMQHRVWVYVPTAWRAHTMGYRWAKLRDVLLAPWLRRVQGWITINDEQAEQLRQGWHIRKPVLCLPNRVRLEGPAPAVPEPAADGRLRLAFVGRFDMHGKGLDWLAAALRQHPALTAHARWLFQGRGAGEAALLELAAAFGPQRVQVQGFAPIDRALAVSDVLLLPSRYEGLPLVALEATARGWPVLASRSAGLRELLPQACTFEFGDVPGLLRAMAALQTPVLRRAAVAHARGALEQLLPTPRYHAARRQVVAALQSDATGGSR